MPKTKAFDNHADAYDEWFDANEFAFRSELNAIQKILPSRGRGTEIGVGSGIFAQPLGITEGVEPSAAMRDKAAQRNIRAIDAVAESLPYPDECMDFALMVTTICFVDDINQSFREACRILKFTGALIVGFVDKNSLMGRRYQEKQKESIFYREAVFYSTEEVINILRHTGFSIQRTCQTVFGNIEDIKAVQEIRDGHGTGSFVVIEAWKRQAS